MMCSSAASLLEHGFFFYGFVSLFVLSLCFACNWYVALADLVSLARAVEWHGLCSRWLWT